MLAFRPFPYTYTCTCSKISISLLHRSLIRKKSPDYPTILSSCRPRRQVSVASRTQSLRHHITMAASASQVKLSSNHCGVFHVPSVTEESAAKASQVLQENHEKHHIFLNESGFHSTSAMCTSSPASRFHSPFVDTPLQISAYFRSPSFLL